MHELSYENGKIFEKHMVADGIKTVEKIMDVMKVFK